MKDHWKSFDYAAILAGLTAMTVFFFADPAVPPRL